MPLRGKRVIDRNKSRCLVIRCFPCQVKLLLSGNRSLPGVGPLSKFFEDVKVEVKVFPKSARSDCLQLKIIQMPKWHVLEWHILLPFSLFPIAGVFAL